MEPEWTITELAAAATAALGDAPLGTGGRVRDLPNERLIRWYTTIGLVDPPAGRRGRTALYGRRHLLQLVAIKRRQAAGRTIAQIQTELTGATDAMLSRIARLPASPSREAPQDRQDAPTPAAAPPERGRFWAQQAASPQQPAAPQQAASEQATTGERAAPAEQAAPSGQAAEPEQAASGEQAARRGQAGKGHPGRAAVREQDGPVGPTPVQGVRLAPGVTLLLDTAAGALTPDDLAAIGSAAEPLLAELRRRALSPADVNDAPTSPPDDPALPTDAHGRPL